VLRIGEADHGFSAAPPQGNNRRTSRATHAVTPQLAGQVFTQVQSQRTCTARALLDDLNARFQGTGVIADLNMMQPNCSGMR
jgi:hypothetical protein